MTTIKLWYSPGACSLAPHILLHHAGLKFEAIHVKFKAGPSDELRKINPKMRVPVLSIDDQIITETPAIMTAISQLCPERKLLGTTNLEIVRVYEWLNWLSGTLHGQAFGGLLRPARYSHDVSTHKSITTKARKTVEECFEKIERDLKGVHAVGDVFTVVDPYLYVFYRWGTDMGLDLQGRFPKYTRLVVELGEVPGLQKALTAEGVKSLFPKL